MKNDDKRWERREDGKRLVKKKRWKIMMVAEGRIKKRVERRSSRWRMTKGKWELRGREKGKKVVLVDGK